MKSITAKNISIALAQVIGDAILPHNSGTVESRHLDANLVNPEGYAKIVDNQIKVLSFGNFEECTKFAIDLIKKDQEIEVKEIELHRAEGYTDYCDQFPMKFSSFKHVNTFLMSNAHQFPEEGGGYDKHKFTVTWKDGETYDGRLDCKNHSASNNDLNMALHIKDYLDYLIKESKCDDKAEVESFLNTHSFK